MGDEQVKTFGVGSVQWSIVLQLFCCHCLILAVAVVYGVPVLPVITACLLSFLLLLNIPYNLHMLEMTLERLSRGLSVEPLPLRLRWPLTRLFVLVNALGQQTGQQEQREQRNVAYRDQLVQQVSKTAAQEERNRLARDLHDSIKQQIYSIVVNAAAVKVRWEHNPAGARKAIDDIERTAQEAQVEMQALLQQLRPTALENVGLIESLRMQCQALGYRIDAEITAELSELPPDELLPIGAQEMIFRIVQEGFANIARHARAAHVWLSLRQQGDALLVEIGDDGQGFDLALVNERVRAYGVNGTILHYQNGSWSSVQSPTRNTLNGIEMLSTTEGWVVGEQGTILHYRAEDGSWETVYRNPSIDQSANLHGVAMNSVRSGWITGEQHLLTYSSEVWTATKFSIRASATNTQTSDKSIYSLNLYAIALSQSGEGWAVGSSDDSGLNTIIILHYQGGTWSVSLTVP